MSAGLPRQLPRLSQILTSCSDPDYIISVIRAIWKPAKAFRLLVAGSASGELVGALRERGIDAWGIENNRYIHAKTPDALNAYNLFGTVEKLPFKDNEFDFIYETCLAHVTPRRINKAVSELHRVTRTGVYFGSVTSDQNSDVCDRYDLLRGVKKLATWWEWSEVFFEKDFELSVEDDMLLDKVWELTLKARKGPGEWYDDAESLRYCFFTKAQN
jgi:SAM-dependent methyltransferase